MIAARFSATLPGGNLPVLSRKIGQYLRVCLPDPKVTDPPSVHESVLQLRMTLADAYGTTTYPTYNKLAIALRRHHVCWIPPVDHHEWVTVLDIAAYVMNELNRFIRNELPAEAETDSFYGHLKKAANASVLGGVNYVRAYARATERTYTDALLHALGRTEGCEDHVGTVETAKIRLHPDLVEAFLTDYLRYDRPGAPKLGLETGKSLSELINAQLLTTFLLMPLASQSVERYQSLASKSFAYCASTTLNNAVYSVDANS